MDDAQAEAVALAALTLAVAVRDEGPAAVRTAAAEVLRTAGGDPLAALTVVAALVDVEQPIKAWWQQPTQPHLAAEIATPLEPDAEPPLHGTHARYLLHLVQNETPCRPCRAASVSRSGRGGGPAHGTHSGFNSHRVRREDPCPPCRKAEQTYQSARHQRRRNQRREVA